jgi:hypothetical protein
MTKVERNMKRSLCLSLVCLWTIISCSGQRPPDSNDAEVAQRMFSATKDHRYDEAVRIGLEALKAKPLDGLLLLQVSLVYLQRAVDDPKQRERWLDLLTEYASKAVAATPSDELNYFNAARNYESAGDFSTEKKCSYYHRSIELFDALSAGLSAPSGVPEDAASSVKLRKNGQEGASRVAQKSIAAGCMKAAGRRN